MVQLLGIKADKQQNLKRDWSILYLNIGQKAIVNRESNLAVVYFAIHALISYITFDPACKTFPFIIQLTLSRLLLFHVY